MTGGGWKRVFRVGDHRRDVDEELAYHRERTLEELRARGLTSAEAEREAHRRFGDERRWRRELERQDRWAHARRTLVERLGVAVDVLRSSARGLVRNPALSVGIVLTFGLGVGANAVMFGVVDRLLLRPPPHVAAPDQVRRVLVERTPLGSFSMRGGSLPRARQVSSSLTYPDVADLDTLAVFAGVAAYNNRELVLGRGPEAQELNGILAAGDYFQVLGVRPALGRFFGPDEDAIGGAPVAVISHGLWQRQFGSDPGVLGQLLDLNLPGGPFEVVGVAPREFTGVDLRRADVWLPLLAAHPGAETFRNSRNWYFLRAVARLAPATAAEAAASRASLAHRLGREASVAEGMYDEDAEVVLSSLLAARGPLASNESVVARWLAGVSLLVLLIACANVANLLLTRSARRRRETAVRLALGISRRRLAAQLLFDGLTLALLGGATALLAARWGGSLVHGLLLPDLGWAGGLDTRVAGFTILLALVAGAAASLLPIVQARTAEVSATLRAGGHGALGGGGSRLRSGLSALQAALSVILLVGAGLFVRSLDRVARVDLGFEPAGLVMVEPVGEGLSGQARGPVLEQAAQRLSAMGGVVAASVTGGSSPYWSEIVTQLALPGEDSLPAMEGGFPLVHVVDDAYLQAMDLQLLAGRGIRRDDVAGAPPVMVVNAALAEGLWPGQNPLGRCLEVQEGPCAEIVGVVENAHIGRGMAETPVPQFYVPLAQGLVDTTPTSVMVRLGRPDRPGAVAELRAALADLDPRVRHVNMLPMSELIAPYTRSWVLGAALFTAFGLLALLVAGIGLYSVLAYDVARRTPEIGIRSALGAGRGRIVRDVVGRSVRVAAAGLAGGLVLALVLAPRIRDQLYEVSPRDPLTFVAVVTVLLAVAVAAASAPALRASRVDPNEALRAE